MVKNGLLEREKLPDDARANAVKLTDDGRALLEAATLGAKEADKAILSALPKNKRASFLETLRRIAETLEKGEEAAKQAKIKVKEKKKKAKKKAKEKAKAKAKKAARKSKKVSADAAPKTGT
jgi:DNA-binding PadR family transcriptional regulator